ncbi:MAG: molybdopterin molybdotransferase MoeA [Candidatus Manganitrophus sp. SA1]|nr:molybdopterin molybdotransferase MoeA [Candidatus Manganitrophus morganii]
MMSQKDDPVQTALESFLAVVPQGVSGAEKVPLSSARGRILAADVTAGVDDPPYSRSIMEGYVLVASEAAAASAERPVTLNVVGEIPVGAGEAKGLGPGTAMRVTTGSYIPAGNFAVVKQWDVTQEGNRIRLTRPLSQNENIETQGCDRKKGGLLFAKGRRITPADIFLLAGQGILEVSVAKRPRVAIFSSGNEVIPPTEPFRAGAIWDCNSFGLSALVEEAGGTPLFKGIVKDDFDLFAKRLKEALAESEMVVISGGTAIGGRDFTVDLVNAAGAPGAVVKGVPMRSGKPLVLGAAGSKPIVCVAGHPPEAARGFNLFGRPALGRLLGETVEAPAQK